ncbi:MAG: UDP-N-acetylmuramoyl-L-alanine--D-glutamate ligase [Bacteroidetes bacterium]|nr:MAG: UDP-N-acetylmuramoyl-L-alanine--D-glutamate ligase [Bacteroidota bacterium]
MLNKLPSIIQDKRIVLLGFGMEGQSSFRFFSKNFPKNNFLIADKNPDIREHPLLQQADIEISTGQNYLSSISDNDFIIKSPGIKLPENCKLNHDSIFSQTDLFIQAFRKQIIGVTGTKGKSTTSSLLFKILSDQNKKAILIGNIGKPALDYWDKIEDDTFIVFELSAHQLEYTRFSPTYSILLNLFPEHLDYFKTENNYFKAKLNIAKFQSEGEFFFCNQTELIKEGFSFLKDKIYSSNYTLINDSIKRKNDYKKLIHIDEMLYLKGLHQLKNCIPILNLTNILGLNEELTLESIRNFKPLPHRIEFIGKIKKLQFYNDSISTIPEASIEALKSLKKVDYLILGGLDRKLNYQKLYAFLEKFTLNTIFFIGPAGKRMFDELANNSKFKKIHIEKLHLFEPHLENIIQENKNSICLLSPAAASYDEFKNFEERGDYFRSLIEKFM